MLRSIWQMATKSVSRLARSSLLRVQGDSMRVESWRHSENALAQGLGRNEGADRQARLLFVRGAVPQMPKDDPILGMMSLDCFLSSRCSLSDVYHEDRPAAVPNKKNAPRATPPRSHESCERTNPDADTDAHSDAHPLAGSIHCFRI